MHNNTNKPPRIKPRLQKSPKIRELYWCDFPKDAQLPEFWKRRPVIIISKTSTLSGSVVVIPCSSKSNQNDKVSKKLSMSIDGCPSWAICNNPYTVAVSRLSHNHGEHKPKRLGQEEFNIIIQKLLDFLPSPNFGKD